MSLAVVSERRLLKTVSTNLPHPVSVAPLPFEKRLEVVFVRNRPRRLSRELFDNETNKSTTKRPGTSRVHRSRTSVQQEREMRLNRLFLLGNSSREFLKYPINHGRIPIASSQSSVLESGSTLTGLPASSMLPPSTTLTSAPTQQAAIAQSATLNFEMSRGLINQMQASPNRSSQDSYEPVDPDKPSPVQLSFILDKLREEVLTCGLQYFVVLCIQIDQCTSGITTTIVQLYLFWWVMNQVSVFIAVLFRSRRLILSLV